MSNIALTGNVLGTGTLTIASPNTDVARTLTLPDATGTLFSTADLATNIEAQAGTNTAKLMTPALVTQTIQNTTTATVYAAGGTETDLTTAFENRLTVNITANRKGIWVFGQVCFSPTIGQAVDCFLDVSCWDTVTNTSMASSNGVATLVPAYSGMGAVGNVSVSFPMTGPVIGRVYSLRLAVRKSLNIGPVYPRYMRLTAHCF